MLSTGMDQQKRRKSKVITVIYISPCASNSENQPLTSRMYLSIRKKISQKNWTSRRTKEGREEHFLLPKTSKGKPHGICHILWENDSLTCFVLCFPLWWIHSRVLFCRPSPPFSLIITADNGRKEGERKREKGGTITSRNASASLHRRKWKKTRPIINPSKKEHFFARRSVAVCVETPLF